MTVIRDPLQLRRYDLDDSEVAASGCREVAGSAEARGRLAAARAAAARQEPAAAAERIAPPR